MKTRALSAALPLLCPLLASALVVDKTTFSLTFGSDWWDGNGMDPSIPIHVVADTVHEASGYMQGMPVTPGTTANHYFSNVTQAMALQYTRTDSSEKQIGSHRFKTSGWAETAPEEIEERETRRLYTLDAGGVAFLAWMGFKPGGEPAVAEFEAALATLQIKGTAVRGRRSRPAASAASAGPARLDPLGRARTTAGRVPAGWYVYRR